MSGYLLQVAIGPVQGFIASARRTRDLWCGSLIISEVSKAAAKELADLRAELIFPALAKGAPELEPFPKSNFNVANVILAEIPSEIDKLPGHLAAQAKVAARRRWEAMACDVKAMLRDCIVEERWDKQVDDVIEFYAAWCVLNEENYQGARSRLRTLMDGRKACRDFQPAYGEWGIPKSSLDGARESVFKLRNREVACDQGMRSFIRLAEGEQLDAVGLTKRLAFEFEGDERRTYPSLSRIAVDPWVRGVRRTPGFKAEYDRVLDLCEQLHGKGVLHKIDRYRQYRAFPYEGAVLYRNRHKEFLSETQADQASAGLMAQLSTVLARLALFAGEPDTYLAILVADGDRIGRLISGITELDVHRRFSFRLAEFASLAKSIVTERGGCLVYSGGDDVLAFVPVDQSLDCAWDLQTKFRELLQDVAQPGRTATLSVGLAVGHCQEPLQDLLAHGRRAEEAAKHPDRNGLAVHVHSRGGGPVRIRGLWNSGFYQTLKTAISLHRANRIPDTAAYELKMLAQDYSNWGLGIERTRSALLADISRLLERKRPGGTRIEPDDRSGLTGDLFQSAAEVSENRELYRQVVAFAELLIVARRFARSQEQAEGVSSGEERDAS